MPEFDFINWIVTQQKPSDLVAKAAGDDLAILNWKGLLLVGVDQVLDTVHFDSNIHTPRQIGRKAMNRNLSDCAAMAARPAAAVATVALPRDIGMEYACELYLGMKEAADPFDCQIVGGDTGSWDGKLAMTVTILAKGDKYILRSGAKVGDHIYVTGPLGGSILGRHMTFEPRVKLAMELADKYRISSMIDLSDGLLKDLPHICRASGVGALVDSQLIPVHEDAKSLGDTFLDHALGDGEDYELLFTSPDVIDSQTRIGQIVQGEMQMLRWGVSWNWPGGGWEHPL